MKKTNMVSINMGLINFLTFTMILLKLTDVIDWSWTIILFPLMIQGAIAIMFLLMIVLATMIIAIQEVLKK